MSVSIFQGCLPRMCSQFSKDVAFLIRYSLIKCVKEMSVYSYRAHILNDNLSKEQCGGIGIAGNFQKAVSMSMIKELRMAESFLKKSTSFNFYLFSFF